MLAIVPVLALTFFAALIVVFQWVRPRLGYAWLLAFTGSLAVWVYLIVMRWQGAPFLFMPAWEPSEGLYTSIIFELDRFSWPYAFSLVSLLLAVILTAPARLQFNSNPWSWASNMGLTAAGLFGVLAGTPLALIMAWTLYDIIEFAISIGNAGPGGLTRQAIVALGARLAGTLMAVWAVMASRAQGFALSLDTVPPQIGIYLLMAVGLRLGVVPLYLVTRREKAMRRGLGSVLRLAGAASSLVVIARLPATVVPPNLAVYFLVFTAFAALYGAVRWLLAEDALSGRPFWIISLASMALACAIRGRPDAAIAWGVSIILAGGALFLSSEQRIWLLPFPLLVIAGFTGLPFTPAASGWNGLIVLPFTALDMVFIFIHAILVLGCLQKALAGGQRSAGLDRWALLIYPVGITILLAGQWLAGIAGWNGSFSMGVWWGSLASTVLAAGGLIGLWRTRLLRRKSETGSKPFLSSRVGRRLDAFLRLEWLFRVAGWLYGLVQRLVGFITTVLEGDGGMLWALLLLALLVSLLRPGGGR